jgi:hypothetical protein
MPAMKTAPLLCLLLLCCQGCTETRTFSMSVRNDLPGPVSVCPTKTYGPLEKGWESPEDLAGPPNPAGLETPPGMVIPPGKRLEAPPFKGEFPTERGSAVLRVYAGTPNLTQMNAISVGSVNRLDIPLTPGPNFIDIKPGVDGGMTYERLNGPVPAKQPNQQ